MDALRRWYEFGKELLREADRDGVPNAAAALAFYTMLALFPAAIFALSLLPYLPIPNLKQALLDLLGQLLPSSAAQLFESTVESVVSTRSSQLLSFGLVFALVSASSGVYAMMKQLNRIYEVPEERPYLKARAVALALTLLLFSLLIVTFALIIFGGVVQSYLMEQLGAQPALRLLFALLRWVVIVLSLLAAFALLSRWGVNRRASFRVFTVGNALASAGFLVASFGFRTYVERFADYDAMYGSLGAVIVLLLWLWVTGLALLMGAEFDSLRGGKRREEPSGGERLFAQSDA